MTEPSFSALYRSHAPAVQRRARALLGSDADAWEVVQDVFLSLYERPEQFAGRSQLSTFLYSATTHACLNRIRHRKTSTRLLSARHEETPQPGTQTALDPEWLALLHDILRRLPEPLATVAAYYYVDDLSHEEIAQLVGCSRRQIGKLLERVVGAARALETSC
jgi:RNA polymerase sigma-70 factor (ECF subfamily)